MKQFKSIILIIIIIQPIIFASDYDGGEPFAYLTLGNGADAVAIGKAAVGVSGLSNSFFWNPALSSIQLETSLDFDISIPYTKVDDMTLYSVSSSFPYKKYYFGLMFVSFNIDNIAEAVDGDPAQNNLLTGNYFNHTELMAIGNFSRQMYRENNKFYFGSNIKLLKQKIAGYSDDLMAADFGLLYRNDFFNFGVMLGNVFSSKMRLKTQEEKLPDFVKVGTNIKFIRNLNFSTDLKIQSGKSLKCFIGIKYNWNKNFALMSGYNNEMELFTVGTSIKYKKFKFNYTMSYHEDLDIGHRLGINIFFKNKKLKKQKSEKEKKELMDLKIKNSINKHESQDEDLLYNKKVINVMDKYLDEDKKKVDNNVYLKRMKNILEETEEREQKLKKILDNEIEKTDKDKSKVKKIEPESMDKNVYDSILEQIKVEEPLKDTVNISMQAIKKNTFVIVPKKNIRELKAAVEKRPEEIHKEMKHYLKEYRVKKGDTLWNITRNALIKIYKIEPDANIIYKCIDIIAGKNNKGPQKEFEVGDFSSKLNPHYLIPGQKLVFPDKLIYK